MTQAVRDAQSWESWRMEWHQRGYIDSLLELFGTERLRASLLRLGVPYSEDAQRKPHKQDAAWAEADGCDQVGLLGRLVTAVVSKRLRSLALWSEGWPWKVLLLGHSDLKVRRQALAEMLDTARTLARLGEVTPAEKFQ
eukprot:5616226-Amphidinium_carterae.1